MFVFNHAGGVLLARQNNQETFINVAARVETAGYQLEKVFCFFFSKKKALP